MPTAVPTPKAVKQPNAKAPRKPGRSIWDRILDRKFLFVAALVHVILGIGATFWIISTPAAPRKKFMPPAGGAEAAKSGAEHKVSLGRKQSTMSAPDQAKRVVTNSAFAKVALPEMPEMPTASTDVFANRAIGLGGAGSAFGSTGSPGGGTGGEGSGINFFGLRTRAKSIVILVDVSDSMVMPLNRTPPKGAPGATAMPRQAEKGPATYASLEREIARVIRSLDRGMKFSVVCFAGDVEPFNQALVPASDTEKDRAIRWLQAHNPGLNLVAERRSTEREAAGFERKKDATTNVTKFNHGGTRSFAALEYAFGMNPDAICFVSDGVPTDKLATQILADVQVMQKKLPRPSVVNVVAFLADGGLKFMQELAAQNQGNFKEVKPGMSSFGF
jgi:hypothetical protein